MISRGIRNANPGNIRHSRVMWKGEAETQFDDSFVTFTDATYGIRAIVKILRTYKKMGLQTISQAISRWAPPNENDTGAYVKAVCRDCAINPDDIVNFDTVMPQVVKAIIRRENGSMPYTDAQIQRGIDLASV